MSSVRPQQNIVLAPYTTFKIGGPARFFVETKTVDELKQAVQFANRKRLKVFILGDGSNVLFDDKRFEGMVIQMSDIRCQISDTTKIVCGAGATVEKALNFAINHSLAGLEWAGGLPGTIGGGVRGNAGAFAGEFKDIVESVKALDQKGSVKTYTNAQCKFGYRDSIFKHNGGVVVEVTLVLKPGDKTKLREIADDHIKYRKDRHPLEYGNAGSIFKNIPVEKIPKNIVARWRGVVKNDPFPLVPTALVIRDAGLPGKRVGQAQVSTKHSNYIVNLGGATAKDVKGLIQLVKQRVKKRFGIELEEEIQIL